MSPYKRAEKEDAMQLCKPTRKEMSIKIGSCRDSFESLESMCNDKSNELIKTIDLEQGEEMVVSFWTNDANWFPELIGIAVITKNEAGLMTYSLDFSETTL